MSDSPKYCVARLLAERERLLREERERQAALERARREAEQERRRLERLEQDRKATGDRLNNVQQSVATGIRAEIAGFVPAGKISALNDRLRQTEQVVRDACSDEHLKNASIILQSIQDELRTLVAEAETAKFCADMAAEEAALVGVEQRLGAADRPRSEKFDRAGLLEVVAHLETARSHLQRKALDQARSATSEAQNRLDRHSRVVAEGFANWQKRRDNAEASIAALRDRIAGLRSDQVVTRWMSSELHAIEKELTNVARLIPMESFEQAAETAADLQQKCESIVKAAQDFQLKEDRRQYIVNGIVEVMTQMNFVVQQGSPTLEHPGEPTSATIIQAVRVGGGAVAVSIPQEGQIWYDVAGFPMRTETAANGSAVKSCDEAEEEIERMHQQMKEAFGIEWHCPLSALKLERWSVSGRAECAQAIDARCWNPALVDGAMFGAQL